MDLETKVLLQFKLAIDGILSCLQMTQSDYRHMINHRVVAEVCMKESIKMFSVHAVNVDIQ